MKITTNNTAVTELEADAIVVGVYEGGELTAAATQVDRATDGVLTRLIEAEEIRGKVAELTAILAPAGLKAGRVIVAGLGNKAEFDRGTAYRVAASASKSLAERQRSRIAFCLADDLSDDLVESGICGAIVGSTGQDLYRSEKKLFPAGELSWSGASESAIATGRTLGEAVNLTRRLVNEPAGNIYPETFAQRAEDVASRTGLAIEVWDERRLQDERCGSLLGVAQGSDRPARLVIMRHNGGPDGAAPLALVGKGVTFDSGGLSLKPSDSMKTMKCDMAGAATVLGAMQAIAELRLPVNVIGLVGLVENMVSGKSYKLGDVLTARSGKTIEVLNTDAEGRLVLADVLDVARECGAEAIVDLATLTGACVVALGLDVAGLMTNDPEFCERVEAAAGTCGERAWRLPMFPEFSEQIKSPVADIKNIGEGRWGGAITAAKFLEEFVGDTPWTHMDIAGPSFSDKPKPWVDAGASGVFVRTLVELARSRG